MSENPIPFDPEDLTGYLWTTEEIGCEGHNLLSEIYTAWREMNYQAYLAMRVEKRA